MDVNLKKLVQLRSRLKTIQEVSDKIDDVLNGNLELDDWSQEAYSEKMLLESQLTDLKIEMDLSDDEWDEDE